MPQPKRKTAAKKAATKKTAAKTPPELEIQVNRVTDTPTATDDTQPSEAEQTQEQVDTSDEDRAAGDARRERVMTPGLRGKEPDVVYEPEREPLENAGFDHYSAEEKRRAELDAEREEHNRRTGDASLR